MGANKEPKDITGNRYGRLVVLHKTVDTKTNKTMWVCLCDCGKEKTIPYASLNRGASKSCGCWRSDLLVEKNTGSQRNVTHGLSKTPLHRAWSGMWQRTTNPSNPGYPNYGGRGIRVSERWITFDAFLEDMGSTYQEGLTLDRKDVNGDYCKENCRWATPTVQSHNRRKVKGTSSDYIGIQAQGLKFTARIVKQGVTMHLGTFLDEYSAAIAYDNMSEKMYGDRPNGTTKEE